MSRAPLRLRRLRTLNGLLFICALLGGFHSHATAAAAEKADLIEKAKKEGKVVLYSGVSLEELKEINSVFEKKYPFLKTEVFRSGSARLFARAQAEYRAGKYLADTFGSSFWATQQYFESGLLGTYKSAEREAIPSYCKDTEGYWTCDYINIGAIAYNTKLVPPAKAPKSYQDFLDPWWKGKLALDDTAGVRWYGGMLKIMGPEKGRAYIKKIAQQDISFRRGQNLLAQLLQAGEFHAVLYLFNNDIENLKMKGAPVEWVAPSDQPAILTPHVIALAKNPPHPNAARLYIDFILSKEGQQVLRRLDDVPAREDVPPAIPRLLLSADGKPIKFLSMDFEFAKRVNDLHGEFKLLFALQ